MAHFTVSRDASHNLLWRDVDQVCQFTPVQSLEPRQSNLITSVKKKKCLCSHYCSCLANDIFTLC